MTTPPFHYHTICKSSIFKDINILAYFGPFVNIKKLEKKFSSYIFK